MYELRLSHTQHIKFVQITKTKLKVRKMDVRDLAYMIERPVNTVYKFFSCKETANRFVAAEIATALNIKPKEWR